MVKRWVIIISLFFILIGACVVESIYTRKSFEWLINNVETLQIELSENKDKIDKKEFIEKIGDIHLKWSKKVDVLKGLIWHTGIKDIEIGLARIQVYIAENNYTEAYAEIAGVIDYSSHYLDDFKLIFGNIF